MPILNEATSTVVCVVDCMQRWLATDSCFLSYVCRMPKLQRIRDPLHDLIEFGAGDFESLMWRTLNAREFQRLRRVKQLGFCEMIYPGASHTRFAHSVGVFHTARQLSALLANRVEEFKPDRANVAMAAALVHDIGHGPFSHAFEDALKGLDKGKAKKQKRHELWTSEIIVGDTELGSILAEGGDQFRADVAELLANETPTDIYSAIVSSQFDADRLDYVRRDRMMSGAQHGGFDYPWLLANLEVDKIPLAIDSEHYGEAETLVLGSKAFQAAEAYVLGLFHMYFAVYFHKATRSAEKILTAIIQRVGTHCENGEIDKTGLAKKHPLVTFIATRALEDYLKLDDHVIWASLAEMSDAPDLELKELASRLLNRKLYKAIDIGEMFDGKDESLVRFKMKLKRATEANEFGPIDVFEDQTNRTPYKVRGYDTPEAMSKIHIRKAGGQHEDLANCSDVVKALRTKSIYRVYARSNESAAKVLELTKGI